MENWVSTRVRPTPPDHIGREAFYTVRIVDQGEDCERFPYQVQYGRFGYSSAVNTSGFETLAEAEAFADKVWGFKTYEELRAKVDADLDAMTPGQRALAIANNELSLLKYHSHQSAERDRPVWSAKRNAALALIEQERLNIRQAA